MTTEVKVREPDETRINLDSRKIEYGWVVGEGADEMSNEPVEKVVKLTFFHHADRRVYTASLREVERSTQGAFNVEKFALFDMVSVTSARVARYNRKAFQAFAEDTLANLATFEKVRASDLLGKIA